MTRRWRPEISMVLIIGCHEYATLALSILHVRVDENLETEAVDAAAHDAWFRTKVQEALAETKPTVPHDQVMDDVQALIDRKRHA